MHTTRKNNYTNLSINEELIFKILDIRSIKKIKTIFGMLVDCIIKLVFFLLK